MTQTVDAIRDQLTAAVADGVFAGAVLLAASGSTVRCRLAVGQADRFAGQPMTPDTWFDLASLTKPLATTLAVMALEGEGRIALDAPLVSSLPETAGTDKAALTLRQLLTHTAGLPAWRPYYETVHLLAPTDRAAAMKAHVLAEPLIAPPGERTEYSDLGFMLVGWGVESLEAMPLDTVVRRRVLDPLGIADMGFRRLPVSAGNDPPMAAGQICPWRKRLIKGEVDDDNAHVMGGVAGHAGLFGTADAVHQVVTALWRALNDGSALPWMTARRVRRYLTRQGIAGRALGFDVPTRPGASSGRFFPDTAVGHLGFTGVSFWLDPGAGTTIIFLTNRGHPDRRADGIRAFRPRLHDAVMTGLFDAGS